MEKVKVQILEDETLQEFADFENAEVWLLSLRTQNVDHDSRLVVIDNVAMSELPSSHKIPLLMTEIFERHPNIIIKEIVKVPKIEDNGSAVLDENGLQVFIDQEIEHQDMSFTYEVLTRSKDNFAIKAYTCDEACIKIVE